MIYRIFEAVFMESVIIVRFYVSRALDKREYLVISRDNFC